MGPRSEGARKGTGIARHRIRPCRASMGPRSEGARKARAATARRPMHTCRFNGAALGGSAERRFPEAVTRHELLASMGPRSEGARKVGQEVPPELLPIWLQWGRARRERGKRAWPYRARSRRRSFNGAALGGSAESARGGGGGLAFLCASMGPRSEGARKGRFPPPGPPDVLELQWGRARRERGKPAMRPSA